MPDSSRLLHIDYKNALIGGIVTALVIGVLVVLVGFAGGWQVRALLDSTLPTTRFLCSAVMTVSATTLALMLTLLGLSHNIEAEIKSAHFERIRQIAYVDVIAFTGATVLLLAHILPFGENIDVPLWVYTVAYYGITGGAALLGGTLVAMMMMLYDAVRDLVAVFCGDEDNRLVVQDDDATQPAS